MNKKQMLAAIAAAPDKVSDSDCAYDPNDAASVKAFWAKGKVRLPGQRGPQKQPTKVAITIRYSPEVVGYFRATGEGWQTRMNEALRAYVRRHHTASLKELLMSKQAQTETLTPARRLARRGAV